MINVVIDDRVIQVQEGIQATELVDDRDMRYLVALIDNKYRSMLTKIEQDACVSFLDYSSEEGYRAYKQGILFVFLEAWRRMGMDHPENSLSIRQSISHRTYCQFRTYVSTEQVMEIERQMREIVAERLVFETLETDADGAKMLFEQAGQNDMVERMKHTPPKNYILYKDRAGRYHITYAVVVPHAGYLKEFQITKFDDGMLIRYPTSKVFHASQKFFDTMAEYRNWSEVIEVSDVQTLNRRIEDGDAEEIINLAETHHTLRIADIAAQIKAEFPGKRVVLVSGPSSSGKTTFANRLSMLLKFYGLRTLNISLDDYYKERERVPRDEDGIPDFEALSAIDYMAFSTHITRLLAGEQVILPKFDFMIGRSVPNGRKVVLNSDEIIIAEGIHALNDAITPTLSKSQKHRIYATALTSACFDKLNPLSPTDTRLIRRIVRDYQFRNADAERTISTWQSVRRGEEKNIFPFEQKADMIFNSASVYELAAYKEIAQAQLSEIKEDSPYYGEANRLLDYLAYFKQIDLKFIPRISIMREFLGQ